MTANRNLDGLSARGMISRADTQANPQGSEKRLDVLAYNAPVLAFGALFMLILMYYMNYATDVLLVSPLVIGLIFGIARFWDAIVDALIGYLSDKTKSKWGRRRPWLLASALPIGVTFVMAFAPPRSLEGVQLIAWVSVAIIGFYTATTAFVVPHMALGAELTPDPKVRRRLFGSRWAALSLGYVAGLGGMSVLIAAGTNGVEAARSTALVVGICGALLMAAALLYATLRLRERLDFQARSAGAPLAAFGDVIRNDHARRLLFVAFVENAGASVTGVMGLYVTQYVLDAPQLGPAYFLLWLVASIAAVPVWLHLARFTSKKRLWLTALVISSLSYGSLIFLQRGDVWLMATVMVLTGAAAACGNSMGPALQCDVIDDDERKTGQRKEGTYFACWNLVVKAAGGFTVLLAGMILQFSGFAPGAAQSDATKWAMLAYLALFPLISYLAGAFVLATLKLASAESKNDVG